MTKISKNVSSLLYAFNWRAPIFLASTCHSDIAFGNSHATTRLTTATEHLGVVNKERAKTTAIK